MFSCLRRNLPLHLRTVNKVQLNARKARIYGYRNFLGNRYMSASSKEDIPKSTATLKENVYTIPNLLCVSRIASAPVISYAIIQGSYPFALGLLTFSSFTDLIDGQIARRWPSQASVFGTALDPFADKILMTTVIVSLAYTDLLPLPLAALMIGRDVALIIGGFYYRYKSLEGTKITMKSYFDVTHASTEFHPTMISKVNTALQLGLLWLSLGQPVFQYSDPLFLDGLGYVVAGTTVWSGLSYMVLPNIIKLKK